jgi:adenylyl-sulfate kinase
MNKPEVEVFWSEHAVPAQARWSANGHLPCVVWLTGLSGSGKTTVANALDAKLHSLGAKSYLLDGDNLRHGLTADLGFSEADRERNVKRVAEVAKLMADAGMVVVVALVSPSRSARNMARALLPNGQFMEVHVNTPLSVCERRDTKGLYRRARAGTLQGLTGVNAPYEPPTQPELRLDTSITSVDESINILVNLLAIRGSIPHNRSIANTKIKKGVTHASALER